MYQVTVKGRTLEELKHAVNDISMELGNGSNLVNGISKELRELQANPKTITASEILQLEPKMELAEDEVEVASPYSEAPVITLPEGQTVEVADGEGLDAEGLPWDKRINTDSKKKIVAGTWKIKRGMDINLVNKVKAELKQAIHLQANPIAIPAAPIDAATPAVAMVPEVIAPVTQQVGAAPVNNPTLQSVNVAAVAALAPVAPPVMNGGHTLESFRANMPMVMGTLITEGKITPEYVEQLKAHFGTQEIWNVTEEQKEEMFHTFVNHSIIVKVG